MKIMLVTLLLTALACEAAPYPATSTSVLTDPAKGVAFHGFGFKLKELDRAWTPVPSTGDSIFETLRFEPTKRANQSDATLSIRMDHLPANATLESYAKKWMRDYPSYGFEVLGTKNLQLGGGHAILVDLVQKAKNRQLRQVILQQNDRIAVLTCLDRRDQFSGTLQTCNQVIRGFEWTDVSRAPSNPLTVITK